MQAQDEKSEIKVLSYVWKSALMYITGHYEFEIVQKTYKGKNIIQKTIYRRFSDFEILHEGLIKYNPGCRIPPIPEKSIWCNIYVSNDSMLEKRKKSIEEYLNYIHGHKYLSKNPIYLIFLSDDFERYKNENYQKTTIYDKLSYYKIYLPKFLNFEATLKDYEDEDINLERERESLMRLEKGVAESVRMIENCIKIHLERAEALKNVSVLTKSFENTNLKLEMKDVSEGYKSMKNDMNKNVEIFYHLYDKNKLFASSLENDVFFHLQKYHIEVIGLKDIFDRKDKLEATLRKEKIGMILIYDSLDDFIINDEKKLEINELEIIVSEMNRHLLEEMSTFKTTRERDLIEIMTTFFKVKADFDLEVVQIYEGGRPGFNILNDSTLQIEDHFA